jgi:ABC-type polysaccharide/polyol phosphate export permease
MTEQPEAAMMSRPILSGYEVSKHKTGFGDIVHGLSLWRLWTYLGARDVWRQHEGTLIGPAWSILGQTIFVVGLAYMFSGWMDMDFRTYLPYVGYGFVFWTFMSRIVLEASSCFIRNATVIREIPLPLSFHIYRSIWKDTIFLIFDIVIFTVIAFVLGASVDFFNHFFLFGLLLMYIGCIGVAFFLATLCLRLRSITPIIEMAMRFIFFFTPIIWTAESLRVSELILAINPFSLVLSVTRDTLLGAYAPTEAWIAASIAALAALVGGMLFFASQRKRLPLLAMQV